MSGDHKGTTKAPLGAAHGGVARCPGRLREQHLPDSVSRVPDKYKWWGVREGASSPKVDDPDCEESGYCR